MNKKREATLNLKCSPPAKPTICLYKLNKSKQQITSANIILSAATRNKYHQSSKYFQPGGAKQLEKLRSHLKASCHSSIKKI